MTSLFLTAWMKPLSLDQANDPSFVPDRRLYINGGTRKGIFFTKAADGGFAAHGPTDRERYSSTMARRRDKDRAELHEARELLVGSDFETAFFAGTVSRDLYRDGLRGEAAHFDAIHKILIAHGGVEIVHGHMTSHGDGAYARCRDGSVLSWFSSAEPTECPRDLALYDTIAN